MRQDTTMFKYFNSYSELIKKTSGLTLTIKLFGAGWFVQVTKNNLKKVADSMKKSGKVFSGMISLSSGGQGWAQITMDTLND